MKNMTYLDQFLHTQSGVSGFINRVENHTVLSVRECGDVDYTHNLDTTNIYHK